MKKGGLLEKLTHDKEGICATCGHVVDIGLASAYGCEAHDKLIIGALPPYHCSSNIRCSDWKERNPNEV